MLRALTLALALFDGVDAWTTAARSPPTGARMATDAARTAGPLVMASRRPIVGGNWK
jgi:hypothetical protein